MKEAAEENNSHVPKLRENEEQLQCLSMQLKSLKDSCQCIQEENVKLQKLNEVCFYDILTFIFSKCLIKILLSNVAWNDEL